MGLVWLCSHNLVLWWKFNKTKYIAHINVLVHVKHIFWPVIWIQKDLGPMCFWSHGQSFSGKVYKTKVVVRLPNIKVGQVLTPIPIPLPVTRVWSPKWGLGNFAASNHPHICKRAKLACQVVKIQISWSNLTYFRAHLPCHLSPHNTLYYFNIMTWAMPGSPNKLLC